jgi:hypothetical protein
MPLRRVGGTGVSDEGHKVSEIAGVADGRIHELIGEQPDNDE